MNGSFSSYRIAIFASGAGTNAEKIVDYFRLHRSVKVELIVSSKANAGVLQMARNENISTLLLEKETFFHGNGYVEELMERKINAIVLAGFLWKIPDRLIQAFPDRIINIHPALLPKFGGKGMYGLHVHQAVIAAKEKKSGITIHYVDPIYDHGRIIFQASCTIDPNDTAESLANKIHQLEHANYPKVIGQWIESQNIVKT